MTFINKTAIVTGAAQGIGFEICKQLIQHGASVILNDIDEKLATEAAAQLNAMHENSCFVMAGDSGNYAFIQNLVKTAVEKFGALDIVIANAGITLFGNFFTYTPEAFAKVMQLNLAGSFFLAQAAANVMKEKKSGSILFTSSVTGNQAHKDLAAYGMSKAALQMLAKNLVIEISQYNINVNAIAPGATLTERTMEDPEYENTWNKLIPLNRTSSTLDIAHVALFLVSDEARQITGQTLIIDGGWSCISPSPF